MLRAARIASRSLSSGPGRSIPPGARPQLLLSATGAHRRGVIHNLSAIICEAGASVAGTKKVVLEGRFSLLMSVWLPPDGGCSPASLVAALEKPAAASSEALAGIDLQTQLLDATAAPSASPGGEVEMLRRLRLEVPQRPGIMLAVTSLLRDSGCAISSLDANTEKRGGTIWFTLECLVHVPSSTAVDEVEQALRFWCSADATMLFDEWRDAAPLEHA